MTCNCPFGLMVNIMTGDFCNRRSIKCSRGNDPLGRCQNCADFEVPCTFDRAAKRRGVKAKTAENVDQGRPRSNNTYDPSLTVPGDDFLPSDDPWSSLNDPWSMAIGENESSALQNSWKAFAISSDQMIKTLVQIYFEIVYPM